MRNILVPLIVLLCGLLPARAVDDWIDGIKFTDPATKQWCCNHVDCKRIAETSITQTPAGIIINDTGELWPYARVIWASPDTWVRCQHADGKTRCLIGPHRGS